MSLPASASSSKCVARWKWCSECLAVLGVVAVNLANQGGREGNLGRSFKQEAERYAKIKPGFEVVSFDFHHECKGMRYDRRVSPSVVCL